MFIPVMMLPISATTLTIGELLKELPFAGYACAQLPKLICICAFEMKLFPVPVSLHMPLTKTELLEALSPVIFAIGPRLSPVGEQQQLGAEGVLSHAKSFSGL
jgi:hypothetical protein